MMLVDGKQEDFIAMFGSDEIAIKKRTNDGPIPHIQLDFIVAGGALPAAAQDAIKILAKPSDHIEAFFEEY